MLMRRLAIIIAAVLLLAPCAPTNPLTRAWHFVGHHKRFFIMEGVAIGAATVDAYGLSRCRQTGVENCRAKYGAAWASYGFITGINVVAMPALAESCWKGDGSNKFCYVLGYGGSMGQLGFGIAQWHKGYEPRHVEADAPTPSLLKLRF